MCLRKPKDLNDSLTNIYKIRNVFKHFKDFTDSYLASQKQTSQLCKHVRRNSPENISTNG